MAERNKFVMARSDSDAAIVRFFSDIWHLKEVKGSLTEALYTGVRGRVAIGLSFTTVWIKVLIPIFRDV
jgi:hypothetical protein